MNKEKNNIKVLHRELDWLGLVIQQVIYSYFEHEGHQGHQGHQGHEYKDWREIPLPDLTGDESVYARSVREWDLGVEARLAVALAMAPHLRPDLLDVFFSHNELYNRGFTEFGGMVDKNFGGFLPTGQTLNFLITATNPTMHTAVMEVLAPTHRLMQEQVLDLQLVEASIPVWSGALSLADLWLHYFITGEEVKPELSPSFPAHEITTPLDWDDLVLDYPVMEQVEEINSWLKHGKTLMEDWGLGEKIKPGYRTLFYGPPGTGKTLTASLLGKASGRPVYRVDVSMIVSKYIGETEKNLSKVFDAASYKDWILFFDEADSLFGKRTEARSSNDRHANQQTGYLLQRIEDFPGVVILATNLKTNMDEAFTRRFQSMINFTMPSPDERFQLWNHAFSGTCKLHPEIDVKKLSDHYELAGGAIINVLRYSALSAINRGDTTVSKAELTNSLRRELKKDNKTMDSFL